MTCRTWGLLAQRRVWVHQAIEADRVSRRIGVVRRLECVVAAGHLGSLDLEEIANALADQTDCEHRWLISPETGEVVFWTADSGIDGQTPVDLDELDLLTGRSG